jgi:hypothetical protein
MKVYDKDYLRTELNKMFQYKWVSCLNYHLVPMLIDDIIIFIDKYENKPKV